MYALWNIIILTRRVWSLHVPRRLKLLMYIHGWMELPRVGLEPTTLHTLDRALYQLSYQGSAADWAQISYLIVHLMNRPTINSACTYSTCIHVYACTVHACIRVCMCATCVYVYACTVHTVYACIVHVCTRMYVRYIHVRVRVYM